MISKIRIFWDSTSMTFQRLPAEYKADRSCANYPAAQNLGGAFQEEGVGSF